MGYSCSAQQIVGDLPGSTLSSPSLGAAAFEIGGFCLLSPARARHLHLATCSRMELIKKQNTMHMRSRLRRGWLPWRARGALANGVS